MYRKRKETKSDMASNKNNHDTCSDGQKMPQLEKGQEISLKIEDMGTDGEGIGRLDGYTLFVKDALEGDLVRVKILKTKKRYGYARLLEVIEPSPWRVTAPVHVVAVRSSTAAMKSSLSGKRKRYGTACSGSAALRRFRWSRSWEWTSHIITATKRSFR